MPWVVRIGPISALLASLLTLATFRFPSPQLATASFFLLGVGPILWAVSTATLKQQFTPTALLGRVSAINNLT